MPEALHVLEDWRRSIMILHRAHWEAAGYFEDRNFWLGIVAAGMSAAAGTTAFATLESSSSVLLRALVGAFAMVAAVLAAVQSFLKSSDVAARHKAAGVRFGQLRRELEQLLLTGLPADAAAREALLKDFRARWDEVESNVSPAPSTIYKRVSRNVARYANEGRKAEGPDSAGAP